MVSSAVNSWKKEFTKLKSQENNHNIDSKSVGKFLAVRDLESSICLAHQKED